jgi:hypothetical protein
VTHNQAERKALELRAFQKGLQAASLVLQAEADLMEEQAKLKRKHRRAQYEYARKARAAGNEDLADTHAQHAHDCLLEQKALENGVRRVRRAAVNVLREVYPV